MEAVFARLMNKGKTTDAAAAQRWQRFRRCYSLSIRSDLRRQRSYSLKSNHRGQLAYIWKEAVQSKKEFRDRHS